MHASTLSFILFALRLVYEENFYMQGYSTLVLCLSFLYTDLISSVDFERAIFTEIYIRLTIHLNMCIYIDDIFKTSPKKSQKFKIRTPKHIET
jgi:hypothetical protein